MFVSLRKLVLDKIGIFASIACAIHCAVLPLVVTLLPLIGLSFLANQWFELLMIAFSVIIGLYALLSSYLVHRNVKPLCLLISGLTLIGCGHLVLENLEFVLIPVGGLGIASAHFSNLRINRNLNGKHKH